MIDTIPTLCGSVAGRPSGLGVALHNAGYQALGLPFAYIAMGCDNIDEALRTARSLNFKGLGVSMPHKVSVISRLDAVGEDVQKIGACNTVVFNNGLSEGHNTDWVGARDALREAGVESPKSAIIFGAGGAARAIAYALKEMGCTVHVAARREEEAQQLASDLSLSGASDLQGAPKVRADLLVNATPDASADSPVKLADHELSTTVFDVVFNQLETPLIAEAKSRGMTTVPGWRMLLHQALQQFRLYTREEPPVDAMASVLSKALSPAR